MAVSFFGLLALAVIVLLVLGGVVAVVVLLANPKTRSAGAALLAIGLVVAVVGGALMLGLSLTVPAAQRAATIAEVEQARLEAERAMTREAERLSPGIPLQETKETDDADAEPKKPGATPPAEEPPSAPAEAETAPVADPKAEAEPEGPADTEKPAPDPASGSDTPPEAEEPNSKQDEEPPAAEPRPQWVGQAPGRVGGLYQIAITTDPRPTRAECERELPAAFEDAIGHYVQTELRQSAEVAQEVRLPLTYVQSHIVKQTWLEPVQTISLGQWQRLHVLLQIDQEARQQITKQSDQAQQRVEQRWREASVTQRLCYGGIGLTAVLLLLSVVYASLRVDQAAAGSCRGRLCLAGVALALIVAALALLAVVCVHDSPSMRHPGAAAATPVSQVDYVVVQPQAPRASEDHMALAPRIVLVPVVVLVIAGSGLLLAGKTTRPAGLVVLALILLGGLWVGARFAGAGGVSIGPMEVLIIAVASLYLVVLTVLSKGHWAWVLGLIACFAIAALFTPADPASMILVVILLSVLYTIGVLAWKAPRRSAALETPPRQAVDVEVRQP